MKYLLLITFLTFTSCGLFKSEDVSVGSLKKKLVSITEERDSLLTTNSNLKDSLAQCESTLMRMASNTGTEVAVDEEEQAEPQYEEVTYYEVDNTKCYGKYDDDKLPSCGMSFWDCKDGAVRECMTNVKYKVKTEQRLIKEEE